MKNHKLIFSEVIYPNIVKELIVYYKLNSRANVFAVSQDKGGRL